MLQLTIAPLFLAGAYSNYGNNVPQFDPYIALVWFVLPPLAYVSFLVAIRLRRTRRVSLLFSGIRCGVGFGILFAALAFGPIGLPVLLQDVGEFRDILSSFLRQGSRPMSLEVVSMAARETLGESAMIFAFLLVNYAVLGAVAGGITGIVVQQLSHEEMPA